MMMDYTLSTSAEDLGQLAALGVSPIVGCSTNNDSGFATRHTVIIEVVEGLEFEGGGDRRYYVKLSLENAQWHTQPSLKSRNPAWREYFIGDFVGTKLESPSIVIRVKYRGRARKHHFGVCKIPLLSVSGTESQDRWYDLNPTTATTSNSSSAKSTAAQPKLRLRITCRKCYDKKSEVEVEVQLINSIIGQERDVVARNTAKIAELTAAAGAGEQRKGSKQKVQKLLREITHANKKIRALQAKKQVLLDKARQRKILLSQSEANFCVPSLQQGQRREELHERLLTIRTKLRREHEAFEFHKRYSGEVEGADKEDWTQNTDELKRRLAYLKNRERAYMALLQEAARREKLEGGSDDHTGGGGGGGGDEEELFDVLDNVTGPMDKMKVVRLRSSKNNAEPAPLAAAMKAAGEKRRPSVVGATASPEDLARTSSPFPGVPLHGEGNTNFSALKGANKGRLTDLLLARHDDDEYNYLEDYDFLI